MATSQITVESNQATGGSDRAMASENNSQENGNKDIPDDNQTSADQSESENTASAVLQRSGNPASNPLQSDTNAEIQERLLPTLEEHPDDGSGAVEQDLVPHCDGQEVNSEPPFNPEPDLSQNPNSESSRPDAAASLDDKDGKLWLTYIYVSAYVGRHRRRRTR